MNTDRFKENYSIDSIDVKNTFLRGLQTAPFQGRLCYCYSRPSGDHPERLGGVKSGVTGREITHKKCTYKNTEIFFSAKIAKKPE